MGLSENQRILSGKTWIRISGTMYIICSTVSSVTVKPDFKNKHDLDIYDLR